MPRYKIFISYGGSSAETVGRDMADRLWQQGLQPQIAATGCRGSVSTASQEEIFRWLLTCHAVLAVNADQSYGSRKFIDEVEKARYSRPPTPVVAFIEAGCRALEILTVGCTRIEFQRGAHKRQCKKVAEELRKEIRKSKPKIVGEHKALPRSRIR